MNVSLTARSEAVVREWVERGRHPDLDTAVEEAIGLLDQRNRLEWLRAAVAEADASIERDGLIDWTPDLFDQIEQEAIEAARLGLPIHDDVKP